MHYVDRTIIEQLHRTARRERAQHLYCLLQNMVLWLRARLPGADVSMRDAACC
jgi:hypothetical protein